MEATIVYRVFIYIYRILAKRMEATIVYLGCIGRME